MPEMYAFLSLTMCSVLNISYSFDIFTFCSAKNSSERIDSIFILLTIFIMFSDSCSLISLSFVFILLARSIAVPDGASFFLV